MVMQSNPDPSQVPFVLLVNQSRERQGLSTVDVAEQAYVLLPSFETSNPASFDAACRVGMTVNTADAAFTPEAVETKVTEIQDLGYKDVSVDVITPGKPASGGIYRLADFVVPASDTQGATRRHENHGDTMRDLVEQARRLKEGAAGLSASQVKSTLKR